MTKVCFYYIGRTNSRLELEEDGLTCQPPYCVWGSSMSPGVSTWTYGQLGLVKHLGASTALQEAVK